MYISKDLGDTWTRISISSGFNFVYDVDYKDGVLYAATNNGLKISANLGETWSAYNSDKRLLTDIEFEGDNIYAAGEHGVLISNLKEKKWVEFCAGLGPIWSNVLLLDHEVIYNGTFSKGLWQQSLIKGSFTASNGINGIMADEIKLCPNSAPVDLFSKTGISPNSNGKWSPALKSNNGIFDPKLDAEGIYSFSMASAACDCEMLINVAVSLDNDSNAGQDTELDLCVNDGSFDLFDMVNGNPDVGGVWIPELKSGSNMFDPKFDKAGVYTYSLQTDDCGTDEAKVTIEIADVPDAGTGTEVTLCKSEPVINLFDFLEGSPDINGVWTPAVSGASGEFDPSKDKAGIYTYTVQTGFCEAVSQVKINLVGDAIGQIHSEIEFCTQAGTIDLFDYVGNDIPEGGTWEMLSGKENGHFDPLTDPEGLYVYKVTGFCGTSTVVFDLSVVEETAVSELVINSQGDGASNSIDIEFPQKDLFEYSLNGSDYQKWPRFENLSGGFYTVYGREINGCGRFVREVSILDYPKFFTPNGDGINDLWNLVGVVNESYSLYIFDKFGKYLKNLTEGHQGWDGNYNGRPLPSTDYWFRVEFAAGQTRTGHFSLRR